MRQFCQQVFGILQQTADASVCTIIKLIGVPHIWWQRFNEHRQPWKAGMDSCPKCTIQEKGFSHDVYRC